MTHPISPIGMTPDASITSVGMTKPASSLDFGDLLKSGASSLVADTQQASSLLTAYASGVDVPPHTLVMAMEQAKLSLQLAVEVRNRAVDAYQELTRLQI